MRRLQGLSRLSALIALALCGVTGVAATPPERDLHEALREVPDDPPAAVRAADDAQARSASAQVVRGPYVSRQVNVDHLGANIVGDAANEPSIAIDPADPQRIVIGWRQFDSISSNFRQAGWAHTADAGRSWTFPGVLTPGTFRSDPVLDTDATGNFYYQSLLSSFDLSVFKSGDGGVNWGAPVPAFGGDKNWMVVDRSGGQGDGHVYGSWQAVAGCCAPASFSRSTDGATSFEPPLVVQFAPGIGTMAVGPDGELYLAGIDESAGQNVNRIVLARSSDARDASGTPTFTGTVVDLGGGLAFQAPPNPAGLLGQINVAVDLSDRSSRGNVYLLASLAPAGQAGSPPPTDVFFARSTDGGTTFSAPLRVNPDPIPNLTWQWFGALSVAPNGRIDAIWNNTGGNTSPLVSELTYSYSWDEGRTWSAPVPVTPAWDSTLGWPSQNKIGDYYTLISDANGAAVAYAATFNQEQDVWFVRIFPDCNGNSVSDVHDIATGQSVDCNVNGIPDACEAVVSCTAAGRLRADPPLRVAKTGDGRLALSWSASCSLGDTDYGVYEGPLGGGFAGHSAVLCTTSGATDTSLVPDSGDTYYLVTPRNADREGSYGIASDGTERPPGVIACLPRELGACPGF